MQNLDLNFDPPTLQKPRIPFFPGEDSKDIWIYPFIFAKCANNVASLRDVLG